MSLSSIDLGLREILSDPARRQEFFRTITQDDIAAQIRALRKARDLTQINFAALAGMKQSAVSRIEQAEYASWTLATLFKVAAALDARWRMILEPAEDAVKEFEEITTDVSHPAAVVDSAAALSDAPRPLFGDPQAEKVLHSDFGYQSSGRLPAMGSPAPSFPEKRREDDPLAALRGDQSALPWSRTQIGRFYY